MKHFLLSGILCLIGLLSFTSHVSAQEQTINPLNSLPVLSTNVDSPNDIIADLRVDPSSHHLLAYVVPADPASPAPQQGAWHTVAGLNGLTRVAIKVSADGTLVTGADPGGPVTQCTDCIVIGGLSGLTPTALKVGADGTVATSGGASGSVTSISTTSPISGGAITTTGTISCPTCVVATSPGVGLAHFAGSTQTVTSSAVTSADATGNTSGSGNFCLVTSCAMTTPNLGTPSAGTLTNATGLPINGVVSATGAITTIADGDNPLIINCALTSGTTCLTTGETTAATTTGAVEDQVTTLTGSTAIPLQISQGTTGPTTGNAPPVIQILTVAAGAAGSGAGVGRVGAGISLAMGAGGAAGATATFGGNGGSFTINPMGAGGGCTLTNCHGGNAGSYTLTFSSGAQGGATGAGGTGGGFNIGAGNGGGGGATSGTGGTGSNFSVTTGSGGSAAVGATTGAGGNAQFTLGSAGGTGTAGLPGIFKIIGGTVAGANTSAALSITDTWNTTGVVDAGILLNVTNSASGAASKLMDLQIAAASKFSVDKAGNAIAITYATNTNCAAVGTGANPSVVTCTAASAGMFSCATAASTGTCQVNTTAVTANSEIFITQDAADGGASQLNVTCNTGNVLSASAPLLASKNTGVSFTINLGVVGTNPACFEYHIVN